MPLLIQDTDFNRKLLSPARNAEHTRSFLDKGIESFALPGYVVPAGYRFCKLLRSSQYRLITESTEPMTVYVVQTVVSNEYCFPHTSVTQVMVWRIPDLRHDAAVRGLPQRFFEYILDQHDIVVSDSEQTGAGRRFWEVMIAWAFSMGFFVYIADGTQENTDTGGWHIERATDMDSFISIRESDIWGSVPDTHKHRRVVISKRGLA